MAKYSRLITQLLIWVALIIFSFTVLTPYLSNPNSYTKLTQEIDREERNVSILLTATTSASLTLTFLKDDIGTPIAEKLADLSSVFTVILVFLVTEKYLMPIFGLIGSYMILVIELLVIAKLLLKNKKVISQIIKHCFILTLIAVLAIPGSVWISLQIHETFDDSIQTVIDKSVDPELPENYQETENQADKNVWQKIGSWFSKAANEVAGAATEMLEWANNILNRFIDATVVMLVTSIVIPLLTICFLAVAFKRIIWLIIGTNVEYDNNCKEKLLEKSDINIQN